MMESRLAHLANTARLLIACDFDGTIAPIVSRPELARPSPEVMSSLREAASLPNTWVAVVSGRAMADLRTKLGPAPGFWLVGGHGASISGPGLKRQPPDVGRLLDLIGRFLLRFAPIALGFMHERKPASIAVHYRDVRPEDVERVLPLLTYGIALPAGLRVKPGNCVIEFLAVDADKGKALLVIKETLAVSGIVFVGDDHTDEDAFRVLGSGDAAIKVGGAPTCAEFAAKDIETAQKVICDFVASRRSAVAGAHSRQ